MGKIDLCIKSRLFTHWFVQPCLNCLRFRILRIISDVISDLPKCVSKHPSTQLCQQSSSHTIVSAFKLSALNLTDSQKQTKMLEVNKLFYLLMYSFWHFCNTNRLTEQSSIWYQMNIAMVNLADRVKTVIYLCFC